MSKQNNLIVIVGPTAVGKTSLCLDLATHLNTEIVSADSRQFYKELEIGTAKPSPQELSQVKHHFINTHSITEEVSAGIYEKLAIEKLKQLFEKYNTVILTGGSGLYINAVTEGMSKIPKISTEIREELIEELEKQGLKDLWERLRRVDPDYAEKVDKNNPQRIIRALEVYLGTGNTFSSYRNKKPDDRFFKSIKIGLNRTREELYNRINQRMDLMIREGLFEEAKQMYPYRDHNALQTVGYKEIFDYLDGVYDKDEAIRLLKRNSRRYAKRQMTWFNKDHDINWFDTSNKNQIFDFVSRSVSYD